MKLNIKKSSPEIYGHKINTGGDIIIDTMIRLGVRCAFNIVGQGQFNLASAFYRRRNEIDYVGHLNETNLALMAQGYARHLQKPAFCFVYHASGTALALMAVTTAWADRAPLVLVTSTGSRYTKGRDQYAANPRSALDMTAQYTKWSCEVAVPEAIPHTLARAYAIAAEAPMGPVHVAIPTDLYDVDVSRIDFAHDFENCRTFDRTCADETGLDAIAAMLSEARLPVIIAGGEVAQLGAVEALVELAEALGAPVLLEDLPAYMSFPTTHPQYAGSIAANKPLLAMADAVFAVGVEFTENGYSFEGPVFPNPVRLAALSVDQALSAKRLWPELMVSGHPEPSLRRLSAFVNQRGMGSAIRQARLEVSTKRRTERAQSVEAARALDRNRSPLLPQQLIHELAQACGEDWIIVQAGSTVGFHFDSLYEMSNPYDFHSLTGKGSAQGWGGPVATGIQLAAPDRRVLALLGDGNFMFTATAIWIAVQQNLPVVFVVINNNGWASMRGAMRVLGNEDPSAGDFDRMGWTFGDAPIDYVGFARSLGLDGMRATTAAEFNDCLQDAARTARPTLIDVVTEMVDVI